MVFHWQQTPLYSGTAEGPQTYNSRQHSCVERVQRVDGSGQNGTSVEGASGVIEASFETQTGHSDIGSCFRTCVRQTGKLGLQARHVGGVCARQIDLVVTTFGHSLFR